MTHQVLNSKEPIRVFKSDFLERFTHIRPATIPAVGLPIRAALFMWGALTSSVSWLLLVLAWSAGIFFWTLAEYLLHRFLFHATPKSERGKHLIFLMHGIHHAQPMVKTRLVLPLPMSVPTAVVFYGLYYVIFNLLLGIGWWVNPFMSGFLVGYTAYDLIHYALHHAKSKWSVFLTLRRTHLHHHTGIPVRSFGVSSPLWDIVFRTLPTN
ncbi:MAG: sterol desaturase family protein [Anaerolineae bacterium]